MHDRNWRTVVLSDWRTLEAAPSALQADKAFLVLVVHQCGLALQYASLELRGDADVALLAARRTAEAVTFASRELQMDRGFALECVRSNAEVLPLVAEEFRRDRAFVLAAASRNWHVLEFTEPELKNDSTIALVCTRLSYKAMRHAGVELRADTDVMHKAVALDWRSLQFWRLLPEQCEDEASFENPENDSRAQEPDACELADSPEGELCAVHSLVLEATKQNPLALDFAHDELLSNVEFMVDAVAVNMDAMKWVRGAFRSSPGFWIALLQRTPSGWKILVEQGPDSLRGNSDVLTVGIRSHWQALSYGTAELRAQAALVAEAVHQSWEAVELATRVELPVMIAAVKQSWRAVVRLLALSRFPELPALEARPLAETTMVALAQANPQVLRAPELGASEAAVLAAVRCDGRSFQWASQDLQDSREVAYAAVHQTWRALAFASKRLRGSKGLVRKALKESGLALQHATHDLRADREIVLVALKRNTKAIKYVLPNLLAEEDFWVMLGKKHAAGWKLCLDLGLGCTEDEDPGPNLVRGGPGSFNKLADFSKQLPSNHGQQFFKGDSPMPNATSPWPDPATDLQPLRSASFSHLRHDGSWDRRRADWRTGMAGHERHFGSRGR